MERHRFPIEYARRGGERIERERGSRENRTRREARRKRRNDPQRVLSRTHGGNQSELRRKRLVQPALNLGVRLQQKIRVFETAYHRERGSSGKLQHFVMMDADGHEHQRDELGFLRRIYEHYRHAQSRHVPEGDFRPSEGNDKPPMNGVSEQYCLALHRMHRRP